MIRHSWSTPILALGSIAAVMLTATGDAHAQTLSGEALVNALRKGGHVIVMRHAASPNQAPDKAAANADNVNLERQLDDEGRETAAAMGKAFRDLKIPVGEVLSSPTYRALETVKYAEFGEPEERVEQPHHDHRRSASRVAGSRISARSRPISAASTRPPSVVNL